MSGGMASACAAFLRERGPMVPNAAAFAEGWKAREVAGWIAANDTGVRGAVAEQVAQIALLRADFADDWMVACDECSRRLLCTKGLRMADAHEIARQSGWSISPERRGRNLCPTCAPEGMQK